MKVTISCLAKFHALHLAEQLDKRGHLHKLLTSFYSQKRLCLPELRKDMEKITPERVITNILPVLMGRLLNKIPFINRIGRFDYSIEFFDKWAASQLNESDVVVVWSNAATHTLKATKRHAAISVIERGSTHILFQKEILEEEYEKHGLKIKPIDERVVCEELANYLSADYISIPSKFAKQTYIDRGIDSKKLIQVPYGVDLKTFKSSLKEDKIFRVIFVGNLSLRKGVHYLLEAFSKLKLKNAELVLIGSVSPEIDQFLKKYRDCYRYLGVIPHVELCKYLSQGSVFVLPSIEEGLAMVIPQAMACGLPIICTINTGGEEMIRDNKDGFIVPIRNAEAIKEKIIYLYEHPQIREEVGRSAKERVEKEFTWDNYGEKVVSEYLRILSLKR
ncbi:MAG: glycosyltransferase family 4 protein [Candidatus Melainabacteria bacterium]|nr:glycosyltransferase family 4 protein [Candidatus Melainabacteria bacterium]